MGHLSPVDNRGVGRASTVEQGVPAVPRRTQPYPGVASRPHFIAPLRCGNRGSGLLLRPLSRHAQRVARANLLDMPHSTHALAARIAAHASWAVTPDRAARTKPARDAFLKGFEDEVDPDRILPEPERAIRAEHARKAHYLRLALKSANARRERRNRGKVRTGAAA